MEVFVLLGGWDYEGTVILGIYTTEAQARSERAAYIDRVAKEREAETYDLATFDSYTIVRSPLDTPATDANIFNPGIED